MTRKTIILTGFVLLKFFLQYALIDSGYDLHRDEYLHLDQGNHLAWGYLSVPPVTSWISLIIISLGKGVFWVKVFPALFGGLTILVVWKIINELNGTLYALILGATGTLFSVLLRINLLYQPNSLDVLCWAAFFLVIIKLTNTPSRKWFLIGAVVFAIGFLNKYNMVFLIAGVLPPMLISSQRKLFYTKSFGIGVLVAVMLIFPNLVWQYNNDFPVFHHLEELARTQLVYVDRSTFFKSQLLFFIGSLIVIIAGLYALLFYEPFKPYRPFFWTFFLTLIIFAFFRAKDYYAIGLYPVYLAFGSVFLGNILENGRGRYLRVVLVLIPVIVFIPMYDLAFLNKTPEYIVKNSKRYRDLGLLRWEDGKNHSLPQDIADMQGWKELAQKVDAIYGSLPQSNHTLVLCDNYGQAGAINYYTTKGIKAVTFNADYINWFKLDTPYTSLVRVKTATPNSSELKETSPYFRSSAISGSIMNQFAREYGTTIFLFKDAKIDINVRIREEIIAMANHK